MTKNLAKVSCCSRGAQEVQFRILSPKQGAWILKCDSNNCVLYFCPFCGKPLPATGWESDKFLVYVCFEIDGIIAKPVADGDYPSAKPYEHAINVINSLYEQKNDKGKRIYFIRIQTSRYMVRGDGTPDTAFEMGFEEASEWLSKHGVKYDEIAFGKQSADVYVDARACRVESEKGMVDWTENFFPLLEAVKTRKRARSSV